MQLLRNYLIARNPNMTKDTIECVCDVTNTFYDELERTYLGRKMIESHRKWYDEGIAQGIEQGIERLRQELVAALREVLKDRGIAIKPSATRRIMSCTDVDLLRAWIRRALTMKPGETLFDQPIKRGASPRLSGQP
jgi:ABC-type histidine transport system ATPase subunit